jgi:hypothetical protein
MTCSVKSSARSASANESRCVTNSDTLRESIEIRLRSRGYAESVDGELNGHLYIHLGDNSAFRAVGQRVAARKRK